MGFFFATAFMKEKTKAYSKYLKSHAWKTLRAKVIYRDGGRCKICGNAHRSLDVHHITYERFGNELLSDLVTLCDAHHKIIHSRKNNNGKTTQRKNN